MVDLFLLRAGRQLDQDLSLPRVVSVVAVAVIADGRRATLDHHDHIRAHHDGRLCPAREARNGRAKTTRRKTGRRCRDDLPATLCCPDSTAPSGISLEEGLYSRKKSSLHTGLLIPPPPATCPLSSTATPPATPPTHALTHSCAQRTLPDLGGERRGGA